MSSARDKNNFFSKASDEKKARKQQEKERKLREKIEKKIAETGRELEQLKTTCKEQKQKTNEFIDGFIKSILDDDTTPLSPEGRETSRPRG
jgi:hypothetical protein